MEKTVKFNEKEYYPLNPALVYDSNLRFSNNKMDDLLRLWGTQQIPKLKELLYELLIVNDTFPTPPINPFLAQFESEYDGSYHNYTIDEVRMLGRNVDNGIFPSLFCNTNLMRISLTATNFRIFKYGFFYFEDSNLDCIYAPFVTSTFYKYSTLLIKIQNVLGILNYLISKMPDIHKHKDKIVNLMIRMDSLHSSINIMMRNEFIFVADTERLFRSKTKYKALRKHLISSNLIDTHRQDLHKIVFADSFSLDAYQDTILESFEEQLCAEFREFNGQFLKFEDPIFEIHNYTHFNYKSLILNELLPRKKNIIFPVERVLQGATISS